MLLLDLPDELLVSIGKWVSCFDLKDLAHFRSCNRRLCQLLDVSSQSQGQQEQPKNELLSFLLETRNVDPAYRPFMTTNTLARLHLYLVARTAGLLDENRAGFDYGSPEVLEDDPMEGDGVFDTDDNTYITGSQTRLNAVQDVLRRHRTTIRVIVDAHSGTGAPSLWLARQMSASRGMGIVDRWFREFIVTENDDNDDEPSPVIMCAWSLEAAEAAMHSNHPYRENARTGRGWAELRLSLKSENDTTTNANDDVSDLFMVPLRPSYYEGLQPLAPLAAGRLLRRDEGDDDDSSDGYGDFQMHYESSSDDGEYDDENSEEENNNSEEDDELYNTWI